jgi:glutamine amidotransferase
VAFYEGRAARVFKEPVPAAESGCLAFIGQYRFHSDIAIAHIRRANPAAFGRSSANTHPFERELGGRSWVFAHNGKLDGLSDAPIPAPRRFRPIGETDSELAFCLLLDAIADIAGRADAPVHRLIEAMRPSIAQLSGFGEFNFLLSNGSVLFAYAHTRLHRAQRQCREEGCNQRVCLLATEPLTPENWVPLQGLHVFARGDELSLDERSSLQTLVA